MSKHEMKMGSGFQDLKSRVDSTIKSAGGWYRLLNDDVVTGWKDQVAEIVKGGGNDMVDPLNQGIDGFLKLMGADKHEDCQEKYSKEDCDYIYDHAKFSWNKSDDAWDLEKADWKDYDDPKLVQDLRDKFKKHVHTKEDTCRIYSWKQ
eukprot:UN30497